MLNNTISNFIIAMPEIYLITISFVILLYGAFLSIKDNNTNIVFFNKVFSIVLWVLLFTFILMYSVGDIYIYSFNGLFLLSPTIYIYKLILVLLMILIAILSKKHLIDMGIYRYEYMVIFLFFIVANLFLASSNDLMSFYVSLEMSTLCTYLLIFMNKSYSQSNDSGIKYFILGSIGTGFLLYGISLMYGFTGLTNFIEIKRYLSSANTQNWILILSLVMIIIGIGFKLSLAPFHMWTIDVYKGSHTGVLMILTTVAKFTILFVLFRLLFEVFSSLYSYWYYVLMLLIIITALVGFIGAVYQTNFKAFLAYSSIANMSYLLMPILGLNKNSFTYLFIYMILYGSSVIGLLGVSVLFKKDGKQMESLSDFAGMAKNNPYLAFVTSVFLLSMAGVPITSGFFAKTLVLYSVIQSKIYFIAIFVSFLTVVIAYNYIKIIKIIYFDENNNNSLYVYSTKDNLFINIIILLLFLFTIFFIGLMSPIFSFLEGVLLF